MARSRETGTDIFPWSICAAPTQHTLGGRVKAKHVLYMRIADVSDRPLRVSLTDLAGLKRVGEIGVLS